MNEHIGNIGNIKMNFRFLRKLVAGITYNPCSLVETITGENPRSFISAARTFGKIPCERRRMPQAAVVGEIVERCWVEFTNSPRHDSSHKAYKTIKRIIFDHAMLQSQASN